MKNASEWVLKAILNRYPPDLRERLESFLSKEEKESLDAMPSADVDTNAEEPPILHRVHWSWLLPIFQALPLKDQKVFLSALDPSLTTNLCRELKIRTAPSEPASKIAQEFILQTLTENLTETAPHLLPVYFLPSTPLSPLLHFHKNQLTKLINILSLTDLAVELKQIVETKILKKIYSFLSEEELQFLKRVGMISREVSLATPSYLKKWDGTEASFRLFLHKRGLARFGVALSTQHPDFVWYVCHTLDVGRGTALFKLTSTDISRSLAQEFEHQVEELIHKAAI